eukprot:1157599-Pelagomonas_calceolata.AAC.6
MGQQRAATCSSGGVGCELAEAAECSWSFTPCTLKCCRSLQWDTEFPSAFLSKASDLRAVAQASACGQQLLAASLLPG